MFKRLIPMKASNHALFFTCHAFEMKWMSEREREKGWHSLWHRLIDTDWYTFLLVSHIEIKTFPFAARELKIEFHLGSCECWSKQRPKYHPQSHVSCLCLSPSLHVSEGLCFQFEKCVRWKLAAADCDTLHGIVYTIVLRSLNILTN